VEASHFPFLIAPLVVFSVLQNQQIRQRSGHRLALPGLIPGDVCNLLGISPSSICRWRRNREIYGSTHPPLTHMADRPRILNGEQVLSICEQINMASEMYLDEIQNCVALTMQRS